VDKKWKSAEKMPAILDKESETITFDIQSKIVALNEVRCRCVGYESCNAYTASFHFMCNTETRWKQDCKFEFYHKTVTGYHLMTCAHMRNELSNDSDDFCVPSVICCTGLKKMFHFWINTRMHKLEFAPKREVARGINGEEEEEE